MLDFPPILADGSEDAIKFIFGALFVLIWIAGAISSAHKNKQKQARERQVQWERQRQAQWERNQAQAAPPPLPQAQPQHDWQEIYRDLTGTTVDRPRPAPPPVMQEAPPPLPVQQQPRPARRKDRRGPRKREAPAPVPRVEPEEVVTTLLTPSTDLLAGAIGSGEEKRTSRRSSAFSLAGLDANSLRRQFIITEILQPPLAVREERPR